MNVLLQIENAELQCNLNAAGLRDMQSKAVAMP